MRIAVIDLGTNTFNMIIADIGKGKTINRIYQKKHPVKIGKNGINSNLISAEAYNRGLLYLNEHVQTIHRFGADKIIAFATSAIRNASNGKDFVKDAESQTGINIKVIDGLYEAHLIYRGVSALFPDISDNHLILDIGGGSCEFILVRQKQIILQKSYEMGMARLLEMFKFSDPATTDEINNLYSFLESKLSDLFTTLEKFPTHILVGTSGSFDTLSNMISYMLYNRPVSYPNDSYSIEPAHLIKLIGLMLITSMHQKRNVPGMDLMRIEMILPASIFIKFIVDKMTVSKVFHSPYSIKEGAIIEALENDAPYL